ncbi:hypothetical protein Anapl_07125 [Anas platyrhynchos]|uniref:Uncharacterized protein n=1 Tax=Anas platyrhynchos TaxID=8839 RepID=R0LFZ4_ANAPL|nr:hypothetical protein Anapl_07125 [Anas platyrhynchos]
MATRPATVHSALVTKADVKNCWEANRKSKQPRQIRALSSTCSSNSLIQKGAGITARVKSSAEKLMKGVQQLPCEELPSKSLHRGPGMYQEMKTYRYTVRPRCVKELQEASDSTQAKGGYDILSGMERKDRVRYLCQYTNKGLSNKAGSKIDTKRSVCSMRCLRPKAAVATRRYTGSKSYSSSPTPEDHLDLRDATQKACEKRQQSSPSAPSAFGAKSRHGMQVHFASTLPRVSSCSTTPSCIPAGTTSVSPAAAGNPTDKEKTTTHIPPLKGRSKHRDTLLTRRYMLAHIPLPEINILASVLTFTSSSPSAYPPERLYQLPFSQPFAGSLLSLRGSLLSPLPMAAALISISPPPQHIKFHPSLQFHLQNCKLLRTGTTTTCAPVAQHAGPQPCLPVQVLQQAGAGGTSGATSFHQQIPCPTRAPTTSIANLFSF